METVVKLVHPLKVFILISVTPLGMVMEARLVQIEKVAWPISVTLIGMLTEVKPEHPQKA